MKTPAGFCQDIRDELVAYREGGLDGPRASEIRMHLRFCAICREQWIELEELDALLAADASAAAGAASRVSPGFVASTVRAMLAAAAPELPAQGQHSASRPAISAQTRRRLIASIPLTALAASLLLAGLRIVDRPRPAISDPNYSSEAAAVEIHPAFHSLTKDSDFLSAGRLVSGGGAGDLALPVAPTDGIRRVARILASR